MRSVTIGRVRLGRTRICMILGLRVWIPLRSIPASIRCIRPHLRLCWIVGRPTREGMVRCLGRTVPRDSLGSLETRIRIRRVWRRLSPRVVALGEIPFQSENASTMQWLEPTRISWSGDDIRLIRWVGLIPHRVGCGWKRHSEGQ